MNNKNLTIASLRLPGWRRLCLAMLMLPSAAVWAAGAEVPVIAISSQGTSNANSAEARDASVLFYNPAGMALLHGTHVSQPFALIFASTKVTDTGTTRVQDIGQAPDTGSTANCNIYDCMSDQTPDPAQPAVHAQPDGIFPAVLPVGALFATTPLNNEVTLGIGVFSPGGGNLNYKSDWFGRYFIDSVAIETININPSVAVRFDDKHSIGFGVSALIGHAKFKEQVDVTKIAPYLLKGVVNTPQTVIDQLNSQLGGILPADVLSQIIGTLSHVAPNQAKDLLSGLLAGQGLPGLDALDPVLANINLIDPTSTASTTIETLGFGYGWNIGYLYQFSDKARLGISYRAESDIRMNGKLDWDFSNTRSSAIGQALTGDLEDFLVTNYRPDTDARLIFTIPSKLNVGFFSELSDRFDFMLNYTFNKSSVVKNITIELPNQAIEVKQGAPVIAQSWRNTFTAATGLNYRWSDTLTLRTGIQFDQTPISSNKFRNPALADNDRWMGSFGIGYTVDKSTHVDLAYSYLYILPADASFHEACTGTYYEDSAEQGTSECTANGGTFRARYEDSHAHIFGLQINKRL